jgi:hypothetical protein
VSWTATSDWGLEVLEALREWNKCEIALVALDGSTTETLEAFFIWESEESSDAWVRSDNLRR